MFSLSVRRRSDLRVRLCVGLCIALLSVGSSASSPRPAFAAAPSRSGPTRGAAPVAPRTPVAVDDPSVTYGLAWHLDASRARVAWRSSLGAGVTVAVVDSGIDRTHPDLRGQVVGAVSCLDTGGDPDRCGGGAEDLNGHGTHVAGLIAARGNDRRGVIGVAPRAQVLSIRALRSPCGTTCTPTGDTADLAAGVRWALRHDAKVINLSIAGSSRLGPELSDAIAAAWDAGAITVLAGGQRRDTAVFLDARSAVVVTATDQAGRLAPYAPSVDMAPLGIAAPGGLIDDTKETCRIGSEPRGIISTVSRAAGDHSGYACLAGTSMAAAQVSGGIALLLSMGFTRDDALERLLSTARPASGMGAGSMDLADAVAAPLPSGVARRHDAFLVDGRHAPVTMPSAGPFAAPPSTMRRRPLPTWFILVVGGLVAGTVADLWMRRTERRRTGVVAEATGLPPPPDAS